MRIVTKIGNGSVQHAAVYDQESGDIELYCNSLKYQTYFADISDKQPPTIRNVSCKRCLGNQAEWSG